MTARLPTMTETFEEYRERVLGYLGQRDPLRVLRATPRRLERLVSGMSRKDLLMRPALDKWSTVEILAHLADAELAFAWRIRTMVATSGVALAWWDEQVWSEKCAYGRSDSSMSLQLFRALRENTLALLKRLAPKTWQQAFGVHEKRGRQTVSDFLQMEAAHDLNHILQIQRALALAKEKKR